MLTLGLTGGIGAGKSTVAGRLARLGAEIVDADVIAREVVQPGTEGLAEVVEAFGAQVLLPDGTLDRPGLARIVFGSSAQRERLNAILHPRIAARTAQLLATLPAEAVAVYDMPLLVENRLGDGYHLVVVVDAAEDVRVRRLTGRGLDPADARARIAAQADDAARRAAADVWLDNSGSPEALHETVDRLWRERILPFAANLQARRRAPRPDRVSVQQPAADWPRQADRLLARVRRAAGDAVLRADHTGSTAVPGLPAKDIVDLQLVLADLAVADRLQGRLEDAGFARLPGEWRDSGPDGQPLEKRLYAACDPGRPVHLHVRVADGPAWRDQLMFRDWLRGHPAERDGYAAVKMAAQGADIDTYLERKSPWIVAALSRARAWAVGSGWTPDNPGPEPG